MSNESHVSLRILEIPKVQGSYEAYSHALFPQQAYYLRITTTHSLLARQTRQKRGPIFPKELRRPYTEVHSE